MRTLLIDNNEDFLHALAVTATAAGLEVVGTATSGEEGCRLHDTLGPELVLLDVRMPGMNGHEVAEHIRNTRLETKIVLMSGAPSLFTRVLPKESLSAETLRAVVEDLNGSEAVAGISERHRPERALAAGRTARR
jgi:DNA-binding NarL/FixJ family response regulator